MLQLTNFEPCPECGRFANRGLSVDVLIIRDGKILLGLRGREPFKGLWGNIGGYVEWDESAEEAVVRETKEETTLTVTKLQFLKVYTHTNRHPNQVVTISYAVEVEGTPEAGDDVVKLKWFDLTKLPSPLAFDHESIIMDYCKKIPQ